MSMLGEMDDCGSGLPRWSCSILTAAKVSISMQACGSAGHSAEVAVIPSTPCACSFAMNTERESSGIRCSAAREWTSSTRSICVPARTTHGRSRAVPKTLSFGTSSPATCSVTWASHTPVADIIIFISTDNTGVFTRPKKGPMPISPSHTWAGIKKSTMWSRTTHRAHEPCTPLTVQWMHIDGCMTLQSSASIPMRPTLPCRAFGLTGRRIRPVRGCLILRI
ncbi:hypothetical protein ES703_40734 [subsurface metagenome]